MLTKIWLLAMVAITLLYAFLLLERGLVLVSSADPVGIALGLAILFFPFAAIAAIFYEIRFGMSLSRLARLLEQSQIAAPAYELRPSGKAEKASGEAAFRELEQRIQQDEQNYLLWFLLADSYDKLGDRKRARSAARKAISLAKKAKAL